MRREVTLSSRTALRHGARMVERYTFPAVVGGCPVARTEDQSWSRHDRAQGTLHIGYDTADRFVRIEYHWWRWFSRADPDMDDVYTAELWVRRPDGDWTYLLHPGDEVAVRVRHAELRPVLAQALGIDIEA